MSAFIVSPKTINQVLSYLNRENQGGRLGPGYAFRGRGYDFSDTDSLQKLGQDLWDLNHLAVNTRYAHNVDAQADPALDPFVFKFERVDHVQAYKSARCLHYQCSEDKAVETPLYEAFTDVCHSIAHYIITEVVCKTEWDISEWGARD